MSGKQLKQIRNENPTIRSTTSSQMEQQFSTQRPASKAIINYFKDVSLNRDHEATTFKNKFYTPQIREPDADTANHKER